METKTKFKLGPLQKLWIKNLRKYPERQMRNVLGSGNAKNYRACCLGELLLCYRRRNHLPLGFENGSLKDGCDGSLPSMSASDLGLHSSSGSIRGDITLKGSYSLASANDNGRTWIEIADFVEKYPEAVFFKSV